ncbi:Penicillinase repressor [Stieleria maiorica]|uniref:Penicillinase repressor n=1 Tax=Stieleria maiorica TaxID=2795974 RepID=A0A5B9MKZ0_9BACT|nr:BlaI/MecI/CopY family transcriptional regulator [Stieleria maiorica]QEG01594.1 Penicillinase repressor [Stieleria maiorica]
MPLRLTGQQLAIMRLLWDRGEMTVADVQESLRGSDRPAYSTVATVLGRLEKRGLVRHRAEGRTYHFSPAVSETGVVREVVDRVFGGSATALVSHLLENEELVQGELEEIKQLIREHERSSQSDRSSEAES